MILETVQSGAGGLLTSGELIDRLATDSQLSRTATRSRIFREARQQQGLWVSKKLQLPGRMRLFADIAATRRPEWLSVAAAKLEASKRHGIARILQYIGLRGYMSMGAIRRILAAPVAVRPNARKPVIERELESLLEIPGVSRKFEGLSTECLCKSEQLSHVKSQSIALTDRADGLVKSSTIKLLKSSSLTSFSYQHPESDDFGNKILNGYAFSDVGMSWVGPLSRRFKNGAVKPTPVALDAYAYEVTNLEVDALVEKLQRCSSGFKTPILGGIAGPGFTPEAFNRAKAAHLVVIPLAALLGEIARDMIQLIEALRNRPLDQWSGEIVRLFEYSADSPLLSDLRSFSLEALAAMHTSVAGFSSFLSLGIKVKWHDTVREIDVLGITPAAPQRVRIVECKALNRQARLTEEDVRKFLNETLPAAITYIRQKYDLSGQFAGFEAELWTTGEVPSEIRSYFDSLPINSAATKKLLDSSAICAALRRAGTGRSERLVECIAGLE